MPLQPPLCRHAPGSTCSADHAAIIVIVIVIVIVTIGVVVVVVVCVISIGAGHEGVEGGALCGVGV